MKIYYIFIGLSFNKNKSNEKIEILEEFDNSDLDQFNTYRQKIFELSIDLIMKT